MYLFLFILNLFSCLHNYLRIPGYSEAYIHLIQSKYTTHYNTYIYIYIYIVNILVFRPKKIRIYFFIAHLDGTRFSPVEWKGNYFKYLYIVLHNQPSNVCLFDGV